MRKSLYIFMFVIVWIFMSCSQKTYNSRTRNMAMDNIIAAQSEEDEGAVQEPAWAYYERLSYIFGADSTCIGISNDMDFPDWYSGCFVNDRNRLTINIIGDTLKTRRMLAKLLQGNEFDLGVGVSSRKEMLRTLSLLDTAVSNMDTVSPSPICREAINGNLIWWGNEDGTITICIEGDNDSIINVFRKDVFDSPLLRFEVHDKVRVNIGCDTLAVEEKSFVSHETSPQFPGGDGAMISYIYDNLRYPKEAYDENIQGRVVVQYLVDKTGNIDSVRIVKNKDPYLDAEAVRIVTSFPRFTPGKFDLTPIDQWMTLPIMFKKTDYDDRKNKKYRAFQYDNGDDYVKDGLYRIVDDRGRIGYADERGTTVIAPRFAFGFPFENGKAKVTDSGQEKEVEGSRGEYHYWDSDDWYYIDKTGRKSGD